MEAATEDEDIPVDLAPAERPFGVLDELGAVSASQYTIATELLARTDVAVPLYTELTNRAQQRKTLIIVKGTAAYTPTTLAWPQPGELVTLADNPIANPGRVNALKSEVELNGLLSAFIDQADGEIQPVSAMVSFVQTTALNALEHGGGVAFVALCVGRTMLYGCVSDLGPGVLRSLARRLDDAQEGLRLAVDGSKLGELHAVANRTYGHLGSMLTIRSGDAEVQISPTSADFTEPPIYRRRPVAAGTYAALRVPRIRRSGLVE